MKKITSILFAGLMISSLGLTSCMDDFGTPNTEDTYGNNSIKEERTISIADLKTKYLSVITANGLQQITEETRIMGVVVGDDESGNIYKQLIVKDETGAIVVGINATGIYAGCPAGQKVVIDCKDLYIGGYGKQAQLGTIYQGSIGRMDNSIWQKHVNLIVQPTLTHSELTPEIFTSDKLKAFNKDLAPVLVTFENVTIREANGELVYAPKAEKDGGNGVNRTLVFADGTTIPLRTSAYCNFANDVMPTEKIAITGILSRYNDSWQIVARTGNDIKVTTNK